MVRDQLGYFCANDRLRDSRYYGQRSAQSRRRTTAASSCLGDRWSLSSAVGI
jgi:hypothetical protein